MFLYYRRRRLRYYRGEEWPFPTLPANGGPRGGGRRRKDDKDYGETPEMYECLLDVKAAAGDVWGAPAAGVQDPDDLAQCQPITVKSLDTKTMPVTSTTTHDTTAPTRPRTLFSRTLSARRNMFTPSPAAEPQEPTTADQVSTYISSSGTAWLPLSVTYLIAMPSAQRDPRGERRPSVVVDDEALEEIPEVELGLTSVSLVVPGVSLTPGEDGAEPTGKKRSRQGTHLVNAEPAGAGETGTGRAIGSDGTLDLVALLNQGR